MTNAETTQRFFNLIDSQSKNMILESIAKHYGQTVQIILDEVLDSEAESLLDYMVGTERSATYLLMKKYQLA
jgi:hypothetical protein